MRKNWKIEYMKLELMAKSFCTGLEDASKCYDSFDVTLLTSSTEGLPNVLIESQARGVPVVFYRCRWRERIIV